jgi:hypothetical protein
MLSLSKILSALILLLATQAHASESYPSRLIRLVVPYPPGALTDNISRAFAVELGKVLDQTIIVENKPGASTVLGTQTAKQAPADGYTVLFAATALLTAIAGLNDPGYKLDDFTPVAVLGNIHFVLMIPSALPAETVSEFITYAGKHPGELNYAMIGIGGPPAYPVRTAQARWKVQMGKRALQGRRADIPGADGQRSTRLLFHSERRDDAEGFRENSTARHGGQRAVRIPARRTDLQGAGLREHHRGELVCTVRTITDSKGDCRKAPPCIGTGHGIGGHARPSPKAGVVSVSRIGRELLSRSATGANAADQRYEATRNHTSVACQRFAQAARAAQPFNSLLQEIE